MINVTVPNDSDQGGDKDVTAAITRDAPQLWEAAAASLLHWHIVVERACWLQQDLQRGSGSWCGWRADDAAPVASDLSSRWPWPVSYTHLTLPTICSV